MRDASLTTTMRLMILLILRGLKLVIVSQKLETILQEPSISLAMSLVMS